MKSEMVDALIVFSVGTLCFLYLYLGTLYLIARMFNQEPPC